MSAARISWHRRLAVRMALLLALALVLFDVLNPLLVDAVFRLFGVPGLDEPVAVMGGVTLESAPFGELDSLVPHGASGLPMPGPPGDIAERLLDGARPDAQGGLRLEQGAFDRIQRELAEKGAGLVWSDRDLRVVQASDDVALQPGMPWRPTDLVEMSDEPAVVQHEPLMLDGEFYGWVSVIVRPFRLMEQLRDELPQALRPFADKPARVLDSSEFDQLFRDQKRLVQAVSWLLTLAAASVLSVAVSRLVTRRLTRLASATAGEPHDGTGLPAPLQVSGNDEIAHLADAFNASRERVVQLLARLDERDADRREWIAQVSHDLRTPLTALLACLERAGDQLERMPQGEDRERLARTLSVAVLDADRVRTLADDLLQIARLDSHEELQRESVLPGELIERCVIGLEPLAGSRDMALSVRLSDGLPPLEADGHLLMRALENVVRNAIQHGRHEVVVSGELLDGEVCIGVLDDGPGFSGGPGPIDPECLPAASRRSGGAGLGLTVTRRIVEVHEGRLLASNPPGGGARVELRLHPA